MVNNEKEIEEFKNILSNYYDKYVLINKHLYLNIFVYDKYWTIRYVVSDKNYGHNILLHDVNVEIRKNVICKSYNIDIIKQLINDPIDHINCLAKERLKYLLKLKFNNNV